MEDNTLDNFIKKSKTERLNIIFRLLNNKYYVDILNSLKNKKYSKEEILGELLKYYKIPKEDLKEIDNIKRFISNYLNNLNKYGLLIKVDDNYKISKLGEIMKKFISKMLKDIYENSNIFPKEIIGNKYIMEAIRNIGEQESIECKEIHQCFKLKNSKLGSNALNKLLGYNLIEYYKIEGRKGYHIIKPKEELRKIYNLIYPIFDVVENPKNINKYIT
ncbi:hypothetical protein YN1_7690 [Nanoarchaeota archaeon]